MRTRRQSRSWTERKRCSLAACHLALHAFSAVALRALAMTEHVIKRLGHQGDGIAEGPDLRSHDPAGRGCDR